MPVRTKGGSQGTTSVEFATSSWPLVAGGSQTIIQSDKPGTALSATNPERAADYNQRIILHAIRLNGPLSRVDLARITGLTPPAVANITRRLFDEGLIRSAGQTRGKRGQPATRMVVDPDACFAMGVHIDRDHVTMVVVDFNGQVRARRSHSIAFALPDAVMAFYETACEPLLEEAGISASQLVGIGVAIPDDLGLIDLPGRTDRYAEWSQLDVATLFAREQGPPVFVENDAAAAAMGELQLGRGQTCSSFFYILIGVGLGGGLVVNGAYFRGADGRSGELGLMRPSGPTGDQIQSVASLSGLSRHLQAAGLSLTDLYADRVCPALETVMDAWTAIVAETLRDAIVAINFLINPSVILIGGGLPGPWVDRLAAQINADLAQNGYGSPALAPVERAVLSVDAPAVGAAILPFSHFLLPRSGALWKVA